MLSNMKIMTRLMLGFSLIALGVIVVGLLGSRGMSESVEALETTFLKVTKPMERLIDMSVDLQRARINLREFLLAEDAEKRETARRTMDELFQSFDRVADEFEKAIIQDSVRNALREVRDDVKAYREETNRIVALASAGKRDEAHALVNGQAKTAAFKAQEAVKKLTEMKIETAKANYEDKVEQASTTRSVIVVACIVAVAAALLIGFFFSRSITVALNKVSQVARSGDLTARFNMTADNEIGELAGAFDSMIDRLEKKAKEMEKIADGDLTVEVEVASENDTLGKTFRAMTMQLRKMVVEVRGAFAEVSNGAREISDASQALSQGATEQASSVEEITSSMTEVGSQAKTSSENADQASVLASAARDAAQQGSERMNSMVEAMNDINGSSQQIAKIIKVIDDIAFQTNLLALNAAVEAARAGKHGKGFAVVAEEVRNLASRSAKAARETAELIEASGRKVANGLSVAQGTSESFATIVGNVVKAADLVGEIAAASKEQAAGISQITQGLTQIDQVTQRNTASAEETASAAQQLTSSSAQIEELFAKFRVGDAGRRARAVRRPAASGKKPPAPPRASKAAPTDVEWGSPGNGTLAVREPDLPAEGSLEPKDVIALDDKEFGRF